MDPLTEYLDACDESHDAFASMHQYPFLLMRASKEELEKNGAFATEMASSRTARKHVDQLQRLHMAGKRLDSEAQSTLVFKVRKGAGNPYPDLITIGRTAQSDICIPDGRISKLHAYFTRDATSGIYSLADAGSRNATWINGVATPTKQPMPLAYGDLVEFGHLGFYFLSAGELRRRIVAAVKPLAS